jgi:hypothetical protein
LIDRREKDMSNEKMARIQTTINEILKLQHVREDKMYTSFCEFTIFSPIDGMDTYGMELEVMNDLTERVYVQDYCNDGRSRDLNVILYKGRPFAIYQWLGKGYVDNEAIFDKEVYSEFIRDFIHEYLAKKEVHIVDKDSAYIVKNYDLAYFEIKNNQLIADNK